MKTIIVIILIAGGYWWFWGRTMAPVTVIEDQLTAVSKHNWAEAYDVLAPELKKAVSVAHLREEFLQNDVLANSANSHFYNREVEENFAVISGTIETWDKKKVEARYVLIKDKDKWVIKELYINNVRFLDPLQDRRY